MKFIPIIFFLFLIFTTGFAQNKIKVGVSLPLTGPAAVWGTDIKNVLLFANAKLANNKFDFDFQDDRCLAPGAVTISKNFIDVQKLKYVIGFGCSSTILPTAASYERAGVLAMVVSASAAEISNLGDYIFRTVPSDAQAAETLYRFIAPRHKKLGILSEETDYTQSFERSMLKLNINQPLTIYTQNYLSSANDYRTELLKLQSKQIDGLFINSQTEEAFLNILRQARTLNIELPIYSAYMANTGTFLKRAGKLGEGIFSVDLPGINNILTPEGSEIYQEFVQQYGEIKTFGFMFISVFEGLRALHAAIESGNPRSHLYSTTFQGLTGDWQFDKNGEIQGLNFAINVVKNNKPEQVQ